MTTKRAVVLFNLGGPDKPDSVQPFLFNLFNDPAIIGAPAPVRWLLAKFISARRAPIAREIYSNLGGGSPLVPQTEAQASALEEALREKGVESRVFICMRYWHPMSGETARAVKDFGPDEIVLLPLYPQFSTSTTGSSLKDWRRAAKKVGITAPTRALGCYPTERGFVAAERDLIAKGVAEATIDGKKPRILFSAHGLPKKIVNAGDPYQWQVEQTAAAIVGGMDQTAFEWIVCYQSRVGPLEWIGPSTDEEIERAGRDRVAVVVVPLAFVSEHSETLVELDIEYRELAEEHHLPGYVRVPAVQTHPLFIEGLARLVRVASTGGLDCAHPSGRRICPDKWIKCPCAGTGETAAAD